MPASLNPSSSSSVPVSAPSQRDEFGRFECGEYTGGDGMQRRMAVDFLKHFKSELHPEMAEFFQQQLDAEERGEPIERPPPRTPSPPVDQMYKARIKEAEALKFRGQDLVTREEYTEAAKVYERSIVLLVGEDLCVPSDGPYRVQKYLGLDEVERSMLMSSCAALGAAIFNASEGAGSDTACVFFDLCYARCSLIGSQGALLCRRSRDHSPSPHYFNKRRTTSAS